jgi:glycosyltransferase involved in cell wall biosynthesis
MSSYERAGGFRHLPSRVIYNGIALNQFAYKPHEFLPKSLRVGMVARLDPIKDHATLLLAWRRVLQVKPDWHLELAGDGPLRPTLESLADQLGIRSNVTFLGWVSDIPALMTEWAMVAHSTTRSEGLGNSLLEAMALGRPLVATDVSPVLEVTDGGKVARISRVGDSDHLAAQLLDVERDWIRSRSLVASARERMVHFFSPEHMVAEYLDCLGLEIPV